MYGYTLIELKSFNLKNGIHHIPLELPWSSPGFVNVYLIEDKDGFIMVDCGVNGDSYYSLLLEYLQKLEIHISDVNLLIGTHMHSDHIGLSTKIRESGVPFALFKNSVDFIDDYNDWSLRFKNLKDYAEKHNAPTSFLNDIASIQTPSYAGKISKPDILLDEGRIKDVKRNLTTIFTPGHDRTEISLFDESTKIIFSGDHILPKITPFIPTDNENEDMLANYTRSLDKIYEIDHEIIAPGHGDIISKPHSRIEQMKLHHKRRTEKILNFLKESDFTGWEMVENLFPRKLDALNLRLAFQETMAHLIYLENKGKIKQESKNNSIFWKII